MIVWIAIALIVVWTTMVLIGGIICFTAKTTRRWMLPFIWSLAPLYLFVGTIGEALTWLNKEV